jgi:threonine synthase
VSRTAPTNGASENTAAPATSADPHSTIHCATCGFSQSDPSPLTACPSCGGLLELLHPDPGARGEALRRRFAARRADALARPVDQRLPSLDSGVWRFHELVLPGAASPISHPEGNTPLLARDAIAAYAGLEQLWLKHEGHNPTGSFKDRGMTVALTQAVRVGARAVACASTGNTSASLAAYAAHAGLPALVLVPAGQVALGKLAQALAYGARTLLVRGSFDDCMRLVREASDQLGVYLVNSVNPYRIEGQKTIIFEMLEQLGWRSPDWIVFPAGNLGNTAAFGKALREAHALGLIDRVPRLGAVQAAGAAPFARSYADAFAHRHRVEAETIATAIRIGDPASYDRGVEAIRYTRGVVTAVSDDAILDAKAVIDASGVGCEPASAASIAGVRRLLGEGVIGRDERVVAVLTGHVLKDPAVLLRYHREQEPAPARANPPVEIEGTIEEVARVLARTAP